MNSEILTVPMDIQSMCDEIEIFIREKYNDLKRAGAVIALSGGLDSTVTAMLTIRSLGIDKVHLIYMPEKDSNPIHRDHAKKLASHLGTNLIIRKISPILKAVKTYKILPLRFIPGRRLRMNAVEYGRTHFLKHNDERLLIDRLEPELNSWIAKGNVYGMSKHRIRMVVLYQFAELKNLMVVGAANRTELLTGTFSKWGVDHCADIMPVIHIYRSQLEKIAEYIEVPDYIRNKPSDPDIIPAKLNKGEFLGGFETADKILYNMENGMEKADFYQYFDNKLVDQIFQLFESSKHMRESPYHL